MAEENNKEPILDPDRELPAPHDMQLEKGYEKPNQSRNRSFPLWIFLLIAILLVIFAGIIYVLNVQRENNKVVPPREPTANPTQIPTPTDIPIDISSWKSYDNSKFHYTFKYPPDATVFIGKLASADGQFVNSPNSVQISLPIKSAFDNSLFTVTVGTSPNDKGLNPDIFNEDIPTKSVTIGGIQGNASAEPVPGLVSSMQFGVVHNKMYYLISDTSYSSPTVKAMIESFQFTNVKPSPSVTQVMKACTMDVKVCPDGSSVGRTGPNCEFAACPNE